MQTPFSTVLSLLIESPGNIIYHLALAFSVISSFQAALISRRSRKDAISNRLVFGLGMLLFGQVILYIFSGLAWQNVLDERTFVPPLDRAVTVFSLVWIVWLWVFPKPARLGDLVTGFLNLGVVILFLFTYTAWIQQNATEHFNRTWIDNAWELAALFIVLTGMAVLLFSRPPGWEFGTGMLSLFLAGSVAHLLLAPTDKDLSGYMRLAQLAAYPLLPTLLNRFSLAPVVSAPATQAPKPAAAPVPYPRTQERRRFSADPRTVHAWMALNTATDPLQVMEGMAKALAHTMLSDICFLVSSSPFGQVVLQVGYDLVREEKIAGTALDQNQVPALATALQRGKGLLVSQADVQTADLKALSSALGLSEAGCLMFIPLMNGGKPQGGILFLSPYSNRQWSSDDQGFLNSEIENISIILQRAQQPPAPAPTETTPEQVSDTLRAELESLRHDNQVLLIELSEYRSAPPAAAPTAFNNDINALVALLQETQDQIAHLQAENDHLQQALSSNGHGSQLAEDTQRLEQELRQSLQDIATLQNHLAEANARNLILERELRKGDKTANEGLEVITSVVQEIRQPMASINGYTELLLGESVGILGALQRKFLERILAATERLRSILDDLIRVTMISEGPVELFPQPVDLSAIIDGAITDVSSQLREKNVGLQVDLPDDHLQILADRDAIQQIVLHMLQNAGMATPQESNILLRARVQKEQDNEFLLVQVTDQGGGIRPEDLPRVFARNYRAEKPLIQGLGDKGVGLVIAKTLVEAHGGRIWVDSTLGQTTTISILLPLRLSYLSSTAK